MSTLKEAKEADEDEEDAGITIKVMIDSLLWSTFKDEKSQ